MHTLLRALQRRLDGELHFDELHRHIYATDASIFREMPLAVAFPRHKTDVRALIQFAAEHGLSLTQVVLGYLLGQPFPTIPIVGSHTLKQLADTLAAADVRLSAADIAAIDAAH